METTEQLQPITDDLNLMTFKEDGHRYFVHGNQKMSVTDIISFLSNIKYGDIPKEVLEKASERGSNVHFAIETFLKNNISLKLGEDEKDFFYSFLKWEKDYSEDYKVMFSEKSLYSALLDYCGTIDLVLEDENKDIVLVDYKSTTTLDKKLLSLQFAGYGLLFACVFGIKPKKYYALHLKKDGYDFVNIVPDFERFTNILNVMSWYTK